MSVDECDTKKSFSEDCLLAEKDSEAKISITEVSVLPKEHLSAKIFKHCYFLLSGIVTLFSWTAIIAQTPVI